MKIINKDKTNFFLKYKNPIIEIISFIYSTVNEDSDFYWINYEPDTKILSWEKWSETDIIYFVDLNKIKHTQNDIDAIEEVIDHYMQIRNENEGEY